jgi:hypothetical protein
MVSGPAWVRQFPDSASIATLAQPFRDHISAFVRALRRARAIIDPRSMSSRRSQQRAYLMHYAYAIAHGMDLRTVPAMAGVAIAWVHYDQTCQPDLAASRQAAQ